MQHKGRHRNRTCTFRKWYDFPVPSSHLSPPSCKFHLSLILYRLTWLIRWFHASQDLTVLFAAKWPPGAWRRTFLDVHFHFRLFLWIFLLTGEQHPPTERQHETASIWKVDHPKTSIRFHSKNVAKLNPFAHLPIGDEISSSRTLNFWPHYFCTTKQPQNSIIIIIDLNSLKSHRNDNCLKQIPWNFLAHLFPHPTFCTPPGSRPATALLRLPRPAPHSAPPPALRRRGPALPRASALVWRHLWWCPQWCVPSTALPCTKWQGEVVHNVHGENSHLFGVAFGIPD